MNLLLIQKVICTCRNLAMCKVERIHDSIHERKVWIHKYSGLEVCSVLFPLDDYVYSRPYFFQTCEAKWNLLLRLCYVFSIFASGF
jgi:hypothetical protein